MARILSGGRRDAKLGTTPSGKAVWLEKHPTEYKNWSPSDHLYAAVLHEANRTRGGEIGRLHRALAQRSAKLTSHATKAAHVQLQYDDPEIEQIFKKSGSKGTIGEHDKTVIAVLGDPMYSRHFKMPKWNRKVTVLDTPAVAVRHWSELGIPRSKGAHAQRADHFRDLRSRFQAEHQRLLHEGEEAYGKDGALIAGGFRENWPAALKDRIRFVSYGSTLLGDAARLHEALSKSRSPVFQ